MMNPLAAQALSVPVSVLGEGPLWDEDQQRIFWVDIPHGIIHCYRLSDAGYRHWSVPDMVGAVALGTGNHLVAALSSGFAFVDLDTGRVSPVTDPEAQLPDNRFNDGKCDPAGRFWAGTMSLSGKSEAGSLYLLDTDLTCTSKWSGVSISNGLAWTADARTLYYIDTPTRSVLAFDYDRATAAIAQPRTVITIPEQEGFPDGMTIDTEGKLWIAHWDGWQVARWDPDRGSKLQSIPLPVARATSCTFGGPDFRDLYITTAREGLTAAQIREQALAGSLFVCRNTRFQGRPAPRFAGTPPTIPHINNQLK
jgi:sugar lactone lactonase YvrE